MGELSIVYEELAFSAALRRERVFRDGGNPLEIYNDFDLLKKFRLPRCEIMRLLDLLGSRLARSSNGYNPLPPLIQLTLALRFYAVGVFQVDNGDTRWIQQSSICRSIQSVSDLLYEMIGQYARFPKDEEFPTVKQQFYSVAAFPNVIGIIDGTLVPIMSPRHLRETAYFSKKGYHAINVQLVCDAKMVFRNVVVRWPGSTHDAYMWSCSNLRQQFEDNPPNGIFLGDSSYPLEPWLMTPLGEPVTQAEHTYNSALNKTRQIMTNAIGILKSRFRCLHQSGGSLPYTPEHTIKIIAACIMLHNIRRNYRIAYDEDLNELLMDDEDEPDEDDADERDIYFEDQTGLANQLRIIRHFERK